jgi:D-3-phosphoglycerate dehydrogenase / 2-oxoglutarate reductase
VNARIAYFDQWTHPVTGEILRNGSDIEPVRLEIEGDVASNWEGLRSAHGYQALIRTEVSKRPEVAESWLPGAALIDTCPDLLAVCSAGAGYDVVDVDACTAAGVIVCNNSGPGREAVAEHAVGFMLALAKRITLADRLIRSISVVDRSVLRGSELFGKTVGIVGFGKIGARVAEICRLGFGMDVMVHDPFVTAESVREFDVELVDFPVLLASSDFVQVTCPLTEETRGLFGPRAFDAMKPSAFFITTARGPVHDEEALHDALTSGQIAGAGLDVFHQEPPPPDHPLLALGNVVASPHTAGITEEASYHIGVATAEQWMSIFSAQLPPRLLNMDAWPLYCNRFEAIFGRRPPDLS